LKKVSIKQRNALQIGIRKNEEHIRKSHTNYWSRHARLYWLPSNDMYVRERSNSTLTDISRLPLDLIFTRSKPRSNNSLFYRRSGKLEINAAGVCRLTSVAAVASCRCCCC